MLDRSMRVDLNLVPIDKLVNGEVSNDIEDFFLNGIRMILVTPIQQFERRRVEVLSNTAFWSAGSCLPKALGRGWYRSQERPETGRGKVDRRARLARTCSHLSEVAMVDQACGRLSQAANHFC